MIPMTLDDIRLAMQHPEGEQFMAPLIQELAAGRFFGSLLPDLLALGDEAEEDGGDPDPDLFSNLGPAHIDALVALKKGEIIADILVGLGQWLTRCNTLTDGELAAQFRENLALQEELRTENESDAVALHPGGLNTLTLGYLKDLRFQLSEVSALCQDVRVPEGDRIRVQTGIQHVSFLVTRLLQRLIEAFWAQPEIPFRGYTPPGLAEDAMELILQYYMTDDVASALVPPSQAGPARRRSVPDLKEEKEDGGRSHE